MGSESLSSIPSSGTSQFQFDTVSTSPVKIASIEILRLEQKLFNLPFLPSRDSGGLYFIRSRSTDGTVGISVAHQRIEHLYLILQQLVIPYFVGKDARDLESLVDDVYVFHSNYKLAGLALWCCVAWVEFSLLDLLGKVAGKPIGELLGGVIRQEIPVYLSSLRRDTTPEEEVALMEQRLEETGAKAVKFKIGGRMSKNADATPKRSERLISLARKTFGDSVEIYADANGSYDAIKGIEVGKMLEAHNVSFFEEPCPFDELEETKRVADALSMSVAGGEQETSFARFKWMMQQRVVDILQPDVTYNGGFIRAIRVVRAAAEAGIPIAIHNARLGVDPVYMLHLASCIPTQYQEFNARVHEPESWFTPTLEVKNGLLQVPREPGLGIRIDSKVLRRAKRL
jgi:L-alanine-DL-glutamate epimerase-like enolase superfamily enzyme